MARTKKTFEEQFKELDEDQQDMVKAQLDRFKRPGMAGSPASGTATAGEAKSPVLDTMRRGLWRGMENLSRYGQGAAWLPLQLLKLPGSIDEAVSTPERGLSDLVTGSPGKYKPGFWGRVKQGAQNIERELQNSTDFFQEKAGVPKEEHIYPTSERLIPKWVPEMAGTFTQPGPYLSPIKKLMAKEAIKPALKGAAQMGAYSAGVSGMEEFNKKPDNRDWSNVLSNAAAGAALSPLFQRFAGAFERSKLQPVNENALPPGSEKVVLPEPPRPNVARRPPEPPPPPAPTPVNRQLTDYVDVPFESIKSTGDLPYIPTKPLEYQPPKNPTIHAPGPVATGPGNVIQMPGPTVDESTAKKLLEEAAQAALAEKNAPKFGPPPATDIPWTESRGTIAPDAIDPAFMKSYEGPIAGIGRPELPEIPTDLTASLAQQPPTLTKVPQEEKLPLLRTVDSGLPPPPEPVSLSAVYGDSLADFLRAKGGVMDQGGEIGRLEMAGKPFQRGLIKPDGMGLDTAAEIAHEAGYIKNRDINELLSALDQESRGKPVFGLDAPAQHALEDDLFNQQFMKDRRYIDPAEAEFALAPEEPVHPFDLPDEYLPPLEDAWPDPTRAPSEHLGAPTALPELHASDMVPGAPQSSHVPTADQPDIFHAMPGPGPKPAMHEAAPPTPDLPAGHQAAREITEEVTHDADLLGNLRKILNDERGSVNIGGGVGPIERVLTQRRFAEKHPHDFGPVYQQALDRFEWAAAQKHDLHQLGKPYFLLDPADRKVVDKFLRDRRRLRPGITLPPALQPAVQAVDRMMQSSWQLINDVRATKGLPPISQDPNYVPFSRSGDYLTIMDGPNNQRWVSAATTLREAEERMRKLQGQFPGSNVTVKMTAGKKGDLPALDFGTLAQLEKAGFIDRDEFDKIVQQFDLPPGFSAHFRTAQKILGESVDLLDPIERYLDGITNYGARFLHDEPMKELITKIKDPAVRQYAEHYRDYINTKPQEFSRLRGAVAVWDLSLNVGSMFQNATQVPLVGFPIIESHVGKAKAATIFKDATKALLSPTTSDLQILQMAEREGHIRPINAEELFGARGVGQQELEFGSPYIQRQIEKGWLPAPVGQAIRKPLDLAAGGVEHFLSKAGDVNLSIGQKLSYALHRLTGSSAPIAADKAQAAHPVLMQGFASLEEQNRKLGILLGVRTGEALGLSPQESYEFAKKLSRDINFDYSPASRAQAFRGMGAPLGLFMTFQTEYMATLSKLIREQVKQPGFKKLAGAGTTALLGFWTIAGMKGLPLVEDVDLYSSSPGLFSENLPDWAYHGPLSATTGRDVSAKFKVGPRVPYDLLHGEFDPSQVAVAQPFVNIAKGVDWFLNSPQDLPSTQIFAERMLPPAARHLAQAGRWAGLGPAGEIEQGTVGTIRGHTPGPTEEGQRDFFRPSGIDIAGKALTFTPLELSKQYTRGRIQQQLRDKDHAHTTQLVNTAAHHLDRNGVSVPSDALQELAQKHPKTYAELMKAHNLRSSGSRKGSTEQIYREMQEPKVMKR